MITKYLTSAQNDMVSNILCIAKIQSMLKYWKNYHVDHQQKNPHNYRLFK